MLDDMEIGLQMWMAVLTDKKAMDEIMEDDGSRNLSRHVERHDRSG